MPRNEELFRVNFDSPLEQRVYKAYQLFDLKPKVQYRIGLYRADFAFPDLMVIQEVDGKEFHLDKERDAHRDSVLKKKGWTTKRYPGWLCHRLPSVLPADIVLRHLKNPTQEQKDRAAIVMIQFLLQTQPDGEELIKDLRE